MSAFYISVIVCNAVVTVPVICLMSGGCKGLQARIKPACVVFKLSHCAI